METNFVPMKDLSKEISGWGVDADYSRRPAVPMWKKAENTGAHWTTPEQQPGFKDFHSNERPAPTHVFGEAAPAKGLSGLIRAFAFRYSEASFGHWLPLILADRINVVEGLVEDLMRGKIPNPFLEMGLKSELKYNKKNFLIKTGIFSTLLLLPLAFIFLSKKDRSA